MRRIKIIILTILVFGFVINLKAQQGRGGDMPPEGSMSGVVVESGENLPLEYVSVVIYYEKDSTMATGALTDIEGKFSFSELKYGKYYMDVKFLGFEKKRISGIKVTPKSKDVEIGTITLQSNDNEIDDVVISADKKHIEYKIDKKVINVSQDLTSIGGSAVDVLENTPSIETDIDGNVSVRGSSNFTVLINGKPSVLDASDALQQIPASTIDQIEIITNPSAKYDPDGVGGIINVITKQKKSNGFNGIFNATAATQNSYNTDILLNYKIGKFNFFAGGDFAIKNRPGEGYQEQITYFDTGDYNLISNSENNWKRNGYKGNFGFDFYLDDNNTFTFSGDYGLRDFGMEMTSQNEESFVANDGITASTLEYYDRNTLFNINGNYYTASFNYEHKFKQKGHKISTLAYYSKWDADEINSMFEDTTDVNWNKIGDNTYKQKSDETKDRERYRFEVSYQKPIGENHKIEAGYTGRFDIVLSDYFFEVYDYQLDSYVRDDAQTNDLVYKNYIQAAYGIFSGSYKTFGYQAGLRTEYTDRLIQQKDTKYPINRFDFFPSVHLSKQLPGDNQLQASYSRRINRPRGWYLNPFPFYVDKMNVRSGNPELSPEYIDSYEINYMKRIKSSFVSVEAYYRQTNDKIERIQYLTDEGLMLNTFDNLSKDYSIGLEAMTNFSLTKMINFNISGNIYQYNIDGEILDEDISKSTYMWSTRGNATLKFKTGTRVQITGFYRAPSITTQGTTEDFFMVNAAVRQDLFKKRLSITFSAKDIFNTMNHNYTSQTATFYSYNERTHIAPILSLSLSYKINNYNAKKEKREGGDGGDTEEF